MAARLLMGLGCAASAHATGSLNVCSDSAPEGFDVAQFTAQATADAVGTTVYDQLLHIKRGTTDTEPALAEHVDISTDGLTYTVHLRPGVKFHTTPWFKPTRDMNADDVLFSMRRQMDPKSPWLAIAKTGFGAWASFGPAESVKSVNKVDDLTVRITLKQASAPFLSLLASFNIASVYSAEYGTQLLKSGRLAQINTEPVGTGPWSFKSYQKDAVLRLTAHPAYWGGKPSIEHLVFAITPDATVRLQRLKAGECGVGTALHPQTLAQLEGSAVNVIGRTAMATAYIPLNTERRFLSDRRFREALSLALDKKTQLQALLDGRGQIAVGFLPPMMWSADTTLQVRHDPERAKTLVKEAGYTGAELEIIAPVGGFTDFKRAAELMQADRARIGVKVRVRMMEFNEMIKRIGSGRYDISMMAWVGSSDPDSFFSPLLTCAAKKGGTNDSQWCHPAFDELVVAARRSVDRGERTALYRKAQRIVYDEGSIIPVVYPEFFTGVSKKVKGFVAGPLADLGFRGVSLDER